MSSQDATQTDLDRAIFITEQTLRRVVFGEAQIRQSDLERLHCLNNGEPSRFSAETQTTIQAAPVALPVDPFVPGCWMDDPRSTFTNAFHSISNWLVTITNKIYKIICFQA
jgi:hypothetical protein